MNELVNSRRLTRVAHDHFIKHTRWHVIVADRHLTHALLLIVGELHEDIPRRIHMMGDATAHTPIRVVGKNSQHAARRRWVIRHRLVARTLAPHEPQHHALRQVRVNDQALHR